MALKCEIREPEAGRCVIRLQGRLDTHTAASFDEEMDRLDFSTVPVHVLDLAGLDYMSSAGLRSVFKARKRAEQAGGQLLLLDPQPQVRRVFEVVRALPSRSLFASLAELDAYVDAVVRQERQGD